VIKTAIRDWAYQHNDKRWRGLSSNNLSASKGNDFRKMLKTGEGSASSA